MSDATRLDHGMRQRRNVIVAMDRQHQRALPLRHRSCRTGWSDDESGVSGVTYTPSEGQDSRRRNPSAAGGPGRPARTAGSTTGVGHRSPASASMAASVPPAPGRAADRMSALGGGSRRRRDLPYLVLGVALVVAGALGAMLLSTRGAQRVDVVALARDVALGQPLAATDLRVEQVLAGSGVPVVEASDVASVVGRPAAVPLTAGHLLAPGDVGVPAWPPSGQVLMAVAVAPGAYPPELAAGMHVLVVAGPADVAAAGTPQTPPPGTASTDSTDGSEAVVAAVRANPTGAGGAVVSLLMRRGAASAVTAVPVSRLRLIVVPSATAGAALPGALTRSSAPVPPAGSASSSFALSGPAIGRPAGWFSPPAPSPARMPTIRMPAIRMPAAQASATRTSVAQTWLAQTSGAPAAGGA